MKFDKIVDKIAEGTTEMNRDAIEKQIIERVKKQYRCFGDKNKIYNKRVISIFKKKKIYQKEKTIKRRR